MKCRIHGSSVAPILRTCAAASCYSLAACRSIVKIFAEVAAKGYEGFELR